jgi:hypothetical protein
VVIAAVVIADAGYRRLRRARRARTSLAAHMSGNGVWFDSRAWIVTARRP